MKNYAAVINLFTKINKFTAGAAKRAEVFAAVFVIAIVLMLVLPMPVWLVDILIAFNLCISGLLVVVAMYVPGPTGFATFPAVLLLTTLFRLALSVATARLILLQADAGHIVETFGNFVVGGNLVVGLVIFLILTVVQFLVITKGSERVSEVAARFSLDAMPGKQMSIDSDLRAGILTPDQAKAKRSELAKASELHGAMDGAMKYVKGDAIAGIFIVAINLIGGICIGMFQLDMELSRAVNIYSILSIGDALIAQIPALLISLSAGMITTRVTGDDEKEGQKASNVGQDMVRELFREPKALLTASISMVLFGLIPGMPTLIFLLLAGFLIAMGCLGMVKPFVEATEKAKEGAKDRANAKIVDLTSFEATLPFIVRMPEAMRNRPAAETISTAVRMMRNRMLEHNGIPDLQPIAFQFHTTVPADRVQFLLAEVPLLNEEIRLGWVATTESAQRMTDLGFTVIEEVVAGSRRRRVWVRADNPDQLNAAGVRYMPWEAVFAEDIKVEMLRNCQMFVGVHEVQRFTRWAERMCPELGRELGKSVPLARLSEVVQRLVREGVSLRNARLLLESTLEWAQKERDSDVVADYVRIAFKRQLCHEVSRDGLIEVVLLSPELEEKLRGAIRQTSQGTYLDLDPEVEQEVLDRLGELSGTSGTPASPPVLVTAADIRRVVRKLIEEEFFSVPVFSFSELTQHSRVQPVGMIELHGI